MLLLNRMKKYLCLTSLFAAALLLGSTSANAGVHIGFGFSEGGCYRRGYGYYGPGYYSPYYYAPPPAYYYEPAPVYYNTQPPIIVGDSPRPVNAARYDEDERPPASSKKETAPPYGYYNNEGLVKSPWSDFTINKGKHDKGDVVYDANNGKPFRLP
jgi:hypothetical protein